MSQANDLLLISQVTILGSRRAFDTLVRKYQSPMRRLLLGLTGGDQDLADDLAQEAFIKSWLNIDKYKATAKFSTWIFRIAYNVFYDHCQGAKRHQHEDIDKADYLLTQGDAPNVEKNIDLYNALAKIRPEERTAIVLFYLEELKGEDVARIMDIPLSTVKTHLSRGKVHLAELLRR